jgi:hypothetical protein
MWLSQARLRLQESLRKLGVQWIISKVFHPFKSSNQVKFIGQAYEILADGANCFQQARRRLQDSLRKLGVQWVKEDVISVPDRLLTLDTFLHMTEAMGEEMVRKTKMMRKMRLLSMDAE